MIKKFVYDIERSAFNYDAEKAKRMTFEDQRELENIRRFLVKIKILL